MKNNVDLSKKNELYNIIENMSININDETKKRIENYRYADTTEIKTRGDAIELHTNYVDGQRQYLEIMKDGSCSDGKRKKIESAYI